MYSERVKETGLRELGATLSHPIKIILSPITQGADTYVDKIYINTWLIDGKIAKKIAISVITLNFFSITFRFYIFIFFFFFFNFFIFLIIMFAKLNVVLRISSIINTIIILLYYFIINIIIRKKICDISKIK